MSDLKIGEPGQAQRLVAVTSLATSRNSPSNNVQIAALPRLIRFLLRQYQIRISPALGPRCRFYPTCSEYACQCLEKFPLSKALGKVAWRLLRCNQFTPGGVDQP